jgi:hypothetical protein
MTSEEFLKALDEQQVANTQDQKAEQHAKMIADTVSSAVTEALRPFTENPPKVQTIIPKFAEPPKITATVDHTPVIDAINKLTDMVKTRPVHQDYEPVVHVKVPPLDVSPLKGAMKVTLPKTKPAFDLNAFKAQDLDEMEQGVQYVGFVRADGAWYIIKNEEAVNRIRYKFGAVNYPEAWQVASTFEYKLLNEALGEIQT